VGFLDAVLGRRKAARPNLDALFALPSAAITLQVGLDLLPTGRGSVAFRAPEGRAFADLEAEVRRLLDADGGPPISVATDDFGYTWLVVESDPVDLPTVVTDLHAVNTSLVDAGFGPQLLAATVMFADPGGRSLAMVYLFKQGSFYPFAPIEAQTRDTVLELQVRDLLRDDVSVESDLSRWFPIWGAPGL